VTSVFLVQHVHEFEDSSESNKIIGIYSSRELAEAAVRRSLTLDGFRDAPDGFSIDCYTVDEDNWVEGFFTDV
jgi:hypothetical protein